MTRHANARIRLFNFHYNLQLIFLQHGWTALMYASDKGNARIAEQLLARGANPDESAKVG